MEEKSYEARSSTISGHGLFATKDIPKGSKIVEYVGEIISKEEGLKRDERSMKLTGKTYIFELDEEHDMDGEVEYNEARFANHSCDPNAKYIYEDGHIWIISTRDIKSGEEITFNYEFDYDYDGEFKQYPCKCGSHKCVGYIAAEKDWQKIGEYLASEGL